MFSFRNSPKIRPVRCADRSQRRRRRQASVRLALEPLESRVCLSLLISSNRADDVLSFDDQTGEFQGVFAQGGGLVRPGGLAIGPDGNLYVSSNHTNNILRFDGSTGAFIDVFAATFDMTKPSGLIFGPDGNLYVNSHDTNSVLRFDGQTGRYLGPFVSPGSGGLSGPSEGLAFGPDGNLYVNSSNTDAVLRFDGQTGTFIDDFAHGGDLMHPSGLLFGPDGNLFVGSHIVSRILRYDGQTGDFIDVFADAGGLRNPTVFAFGPDGNLYVNSRGTQNVLRFDGMTGEFLDEFIPHNSNLNAPSGMLFVDSTRNLSHGIHSRSVTLSHEMENAAARLDHEIVQLVLAHEAGTVIIPVTPPDSHVGSATLVDLETGSDTGRPASLVELHAVTGMRFAPAVSFDAILNMDRPGSIAVGLGDEI
jgi:outer membrane protein assembly factor BamB